MENISSSKSSSAMFSLPPTFAKTKIVFSIQILRGLAALLVVAHHAILQLSITNKSRIIFPLGAFGVDIFFIISGFVIYVTGDNLKASEFLARRIARVVPLYWLFLTLKIFFILFMGTGATHVLPTPWYIFASYMFIPAYGAAGGDPTPLITAAWTLEFEMFFYIVCTMVLLTFGKKHLISGALFSITTSVAIGLVLSSLHRPEPWPAPVTLLNPLSLEFVGGVGLGWLWQNDKLPSPILATAALIGALLWLLMVPIPGMLSPERSLIWGLPAVAIVGSLVALERSINFSEWKSALLLGDASYSLYLSHTATLPLLGRILTRLHLPPSGFVLGLILSSVGIGIVTHLTVEQPLTRLVRKIMALRIRSPIPKNTEC